jgi:hypothetical protein
MGMRAIKVIDKMENVNERPIRVAKITDAGVYTMKQKPMIPKKK